MCSPDHDRHCALCHGKGRVAEPHHNDCTPGAYRMIQCECVLRRPYVAEVIPSKDDMMDAAIASMGITPAEYWAIQAREWV